jgi:hypothetical protein
MHFSLPEQAEKIDANPWIREELGKVQQLSSTKMEKNEIAHY